MVILNHKNKLIIEQSRFSEVYDLAPRLRLEDKREVEAAGSTVLASLKYGIRNCNKCYSVFTPDKLLIGMFGYKEILKDTAIIWFLGSKEIEDYPLAFTKQGRQVIEEWNKKYTLTNIVYSKNKTHIDWLKILDFYIDEENPIEKNGEKFYKFYKLKKEG